jgi:hypothetical protein
LALQIQRKAFWKRLPVRASEHNSIPFCLKEASVVKMLAPSNGPPENFASLPEKSRRVGVTAQRKAN